MVLIVASDDQKWCQKMFAAEENMIMTNSTNSPGLDLAILSQYNHSIIRFVYYNLWNTCVGTIQHIYQIVVLFEFHINSEFILDVQLYFSFGTFGFWSAYLKPKMGEVVVSNGYYGKDGSLGIISGIFPEWKIISDPCFSKQRFNSECLGNELD